MNRFARMAILLTFPFLVIACASPSTHSSGPADVKPSSVITKTTPYYKDSPAQPMPADGTFPAGTEVTVLKKMGSFTLVRAVDGTRAYVASSDVAPIAK